MNNEPDGVAIPNPLNDDSGSQVLTPAHVRGGSSSKPAPQRPEPPRKKITIELDEKTYEALVGKVIQPLRASSEDAVAELIGQFLTEDAAPAVQWLVDHKKALVTNRNHPKGKNVFEARAIAGGERVLAEHAHELELAGVVARFIEHARGTKR